MNHDHHDHPDDLLPWHANGTLAGEERAAVEAHLAHCGRCRQELEFLRALRDGIQRQGAEASPGELGLKRLRRDLDAAAPEATPERPWWRPALATAALVIIVQGVLLLNLWQTDTAPGITPLGEAGGSLLQVRFDPQAREAQIRALLREVGAVIVDGPSAVGLYRLRLPDAKNDADRQAALERLQRADEVIDHVAAE